MEVAGFRVMRMGCSSCVAKVTKALGGLSGLEVISVRPGHAAVRRDPSTVSDDEVIAALKAAGYDATREVGHVTADRAAGRA